jgi:dynein assembly factor 2
MDRIGAAMKDEGFRKLLFQYAEELADPVNRQQRETEIAMLEAEQGRDVKFVNPEPCYVVKTVLTTPAATKVFVNVCQSDMVDAPSQSRPGYWMVGLVHTSTLH